MTNTDKLAFFIRKYGYGGVVAVMMASTLISFCIFLIILNVIEMVK